MLVKSKTGGKSRAVKKAPARKAGPAGRKAAARGGRPEGPRDKELESVLSEVTAQPQETHVEQWVEIACPYCGEQFEVHVTSDDDGQTLFEDCHVCCRPVALHVHNEEGELQVEAHRS